MAEATSAANSTHASRSSIQNRCWKPRFSSSCNPSGRTGGACSLLSILVSPETRNASPPCPFQAARTSFIVACLHQEYYAGYLLEDTTELSASGSPCDPWTSFSTVALRR